MIENKEEEANKPFDGFIWATMSIPADALKYSADKGKDGEWREERPASEPWLCHGYIMLQIGGF